MLYVPNQGQSGLTSAYTGTSSAEFGATVTADGGANFGVLDTYPPSVLETVLTELEPGEWRVRGVVVDTKDRASAPVTEAIVIEDQSPPGPLALDLALA